MQLPIQLLESLNETSGFNKDAFVKLHASGEQLTSVRLNPAKPISPIINLLPEDKWQDGLTSVPWTSSGYYLPSRPSFTFDPLFHAGCYYVQEASSMFLEQAFRQTVDLTKPIRVLDLCAAPGGKSTHIHSLLSGDSLLVSNEVIRSRASILKDNIIKWGCENVVVTNNDPADFSALQGYFDVIVADAPCSGSGLFRKDRDAVAEWSLNNVQLCSRRQQRILSDVLPALKKGGVLIYSTCSYSKEENEDIVKWLQLEFALEQLPLTVDPGWGITETGVGYRFWPDQAKGEGFFIACLRNKGDNEVQARGDKVNRSSKNHNGLLDKNGSTIAAQWISGNEKVLIREQSTVYAWPEKLFRDFQFLSEKVHVIYAGIRAGEIIRDKMNPDHALAMSNIIASSVIRTELDREQAIRYLQRNEFKAGGEIPGWQLATYRLHALGWMNRLASRINNYYPKELRILKQS